MKTNNLSKIDFQSVRLESSFRFCIILLLFCLCNTNINAQGGGTVAIEHTGSSIDTWDRAVAGKDDSDDDWTNDHYWDFTVDDDNNNTSKWIRFWQSGGNGPNDLLLEVGTQNDQPLNRRPWMNFFGTMNFVNKTNPLALTDRLTIYSDDNTSNIFSEGDENGLKIYSTGGNKLLIGDTNDEVTIGNNLLTLTPTQSTFKGNKTFKGELRNVGFIKVSNYVSQDAFDDNLSISVDGTHSYIESYGDEAGMNISSKTGNKITLGDDNDIMVVNSKNLTLNYGSATDLAQVSINTNAKINNAALTIAGATYIGPKADLAAASSFDKFKPEYLQHFNLWVEDGIVTPNIVLISVDAWKDEVFNSDYSLMPLSELEKYINDNKHLPDVPSEDEVKAKGYSMQKLDATLLGKIEELTLYTIQQDKKIKILEDNLKQYEKIKTDLEELKLAIKTNNK